MASALTMATLSRANNASLAGTCTGRVRVAAAAADDDDARPRVLDLVARHIKLDMTIPTSFNNYLAITSADTSFSCDIPCPISISIPCFRISLPGCSSLTQSGPGSLWDNGII